jgi:DNA-binding response OmpR family regulator
VALEKRVALYGRVPRVEVDMDALLRERGFQVYVVETEEELLDVVRFSQPDVTLLAGKPNLPSLARLLAANQNAGHSVVVVVCPGIAAAEAVPLLDMGTDYVTASHQPDWLAAQLRAWLRRAGRERTAPAVIELGHLRIDLAQRQVTVSGEDISLTPTEFAVLRVLAERPGTVLPSGEIMQQVLGVRLSDPEAQDLLKVHVHRLRQKLEPDSEHPRFIRTVRGHGYMYAFERRSGERVSPVLADAR